jgi:aminoglycoside 2''-phosphotransferase
MDSISRISSLLEQDSLEEVAARLAARVHHHFPELALGSPRLILHGWDVVVLEVDGSLIFRFPRRADVLTGLANEIRLLPLLVDLPLRIPHYQWVAFPDQLEHMEQFGGYVKIPGRALQREQLHPALIEQLGRFLTGLHSLSAVAASQAGVVQYSSADWVQEYAEFYAQVQQVVYPYISHQAQGRTARLWESFLEEVSSEPPAMAVIHRDLDSGHILAAGDPPVLTGVIDWGDAALGDPALDFAGLHWLGGEDLVRAVLEFYPLDLGPAALERIDFYQSLGPYHLALYGLQNGDPARAEEGIRGIENARSQTS